MVDFHSHCLCPPNERTFALRDFRAPEQRFALQALSPQPRKGVTYSPFSACGLVSMTFHTLDPKALIALHSPALFDPQLHSASSCPVPNPISAPLSQLQSFNTHTSFQRSSVELPLVSILPSPPSGRHDSKLTCHFCSPRSLAPPFPPPLDRLAIFGSFALTYSCASAAQTFLWDLKCAFWQSLEQYVTL